MNTEWSVPIFSFLAFLSPTIRAILSFISVAAFFVKVKARIRSGSPPCSRMYAILLVRTLVLPEPAPATMSTGPSTQLTACLCSLFSPSNIASVFCSIMDAKISKIGINLFLSHRFRYPHLEAPEFGYAAQTSVAGIPGIGLAPEVIAHLVTVVRTYGKADLAALLHL